MSSILIFHMCLMFACLVMRHANCHASCSAAHTSTSKTMDTLGFEPRAPRMLSVCDTTTPRALAGMHDNGTFSRRAHSLCWPASARGRAPRQIIRSCPTCHAHSATRPILPFRAIDVARDASPNVMICGQRSDSQMLDSGKRSRGVSQRPRMRS